MIPDQEAVLEIAEVTKRYRPGDPPALDRFGIEVRRGEIVGLLGPNGAGKTTAISIISTLLSPDDGEVRVNGTDAVEHPRKVRSMMGVVPQELALYEELTARENLVFFGRLYGMGGKELEKAVESSLETTGLSESGDKRVAHFSGGMKRRANLAAGILHHPGLLLLDEPTVGIDAQSRNLILERLRSMIGDDTAMLYTTHYMEEAEKLCDRVVILDEGRCIASGSPGALLAEHADCGDLGELFLSMTGKKLRD
jgi:ABC-2 type transport system ATP-binding protein